MKYNQKLWDCDVLKRRILTADKTQNGQRTGGDHTMSKPNTSFADIETNHFDITLSLDKLVRAGAQNMIESSV